MHTNLDNTWSVIELRNSWVWWQALSILTHFGTVYNRTPEKMDVKCDVKPQKTLVINIMIFIY